MLAGKTPCWLLLLKWLSSSRREKNESVATQATRTRRSRGFERPSGVSGFETLKNHSLPTLLALSVRSASRRDESEKVDACVFLAYAL